jgi:hypothetical protein
MRAPRLRDEQRRLAVESYHDPVSDAHDADVILHDGSAWALANEAIGTPTRTADDEALVWLLALVRRRYPRAMRLRLPRVRSDDERRPVSARPVYDGWLIELFLCGQRLTADRRDGLRDWLRQHGVDPPYGDAALTKWVSERRRTWADVEAVLGPSQTRQAGCFS